MSPARAIHRLARQAVQGLGYGVFLALAPIDLLLLAAPVWMAGLLLRERFLAARDGFLPGAVIRTGVALGVVLLAIRAPLKLEDRRVVRLARVDPSLAELAAAKVVLCRSGEPSETFRVVLPSLRPTRREVQEAIERQTGLRVSVRRCSWGANLLLGKSGGPIRIADDPAGTVRPNPARRLDPLP